MLKRCLSLLLVLVLVAGLLPAMPIRTEAAGSDFCFVYEDGNILGRSYRYTLWLDTVTIRDNRTQKTNTYDCNPLGFEVKALSPNNYQLGFGILYSDNGYSRETPWMSVTVSLTGSCLAERSVSFTGTQTVNYTQYTFTGSLTRSARERHGDGEATCTSAAVCTVCGEQYKPVDPNAHSWGSWTSNGNNTHTRTCVYNPSHKETKNCSGGDANCTLRATCTDCGRFYGSVQAGDHQYAVVPTSNGDGTHSYICAHNPSHAIVENCTGGTATCTAKAVCTKCHKGYGQAPQGHVLSRTFTHLATDSEGNPFAYVTQTCANCSHEATAKLTVNSSGVTYTGKPIQGATITYSGNWVGDKDLTVVYSSDNVNVGYVAVGFEKNGKLGFSITPAPLTVTAENREIPYGAQEPEYALTYSGFVNGETDAVLNNGVTVTGEYTQGSPVGTYAITPKGKAQIGNYALTYVPGQVKVTPAAPEYVAPGANNLTYTGSAQPLVTEGSSSMGTVTYATSRNGVYSSDIPTGRDAGSYTVYYKVTPTDAANYSEYVGSVAVTIARQQVAAPVIGSKVYNGAVQTADVPASDRYTVTENLGGTDCGEYDLKLTLTDPGNYRWAGTTDSVLEMKFTITAAQNAWIREPSIQGWTYGETPAVPNMGEARYGSETVTLMYVGTTNAGEAFESASAPTQAGSYRAVFTVPAGSNYEVLVKEVPFTVARAALPADGAFAYTQPVLTYNGQQQSISVTTDLPGVAAEDITLNYSALPKNAGAYTFTVSVARSANYEASAAPLESTDWKFVIQKAMPVILWETGEYTYNARPQGEAAVTLVNGETYSGTVQYHSGPDGNTARAGLPTNAGTYYLRADIAGQDNYLPASATTYITIRPKEVTPTVVLTQETVTWDGQPKTPAVKAMDGENEIPAGEYAVTYEDNSEAGVATVRIGDRAAGNYSVGNAAAAFLILPDASGLDGVDTTNVTAEHAAAIDAIQAQMAGKDITQASQAAQAEWNALAKRCGDLEKVITDTAAKAAEITGDTAALPASIKTSDLEAIQDILDQYESIEDNLTEEQKEDLADEIEKLETLKDAITDANDALKQITDGTGALDKDDLDFADKSTMADLQKKIDDLEDNTYLTEAQKQTLAAAEDKLEDLEAEFEEAEEVEDLLNALPATVGTDREKTVDVYETARDAYEALGADRDKVDPDAVKKLETLRTALTTYKITKGSGSRWSKGSTSTLTFTADGQYGDFVGVKVNGQLIAASNYTAKAGSTVVTLKASYLQTLKVGTYTIAICFGEDDLYGEATGTFKVANTAGNPFTGDSGNIQMWGGMAVVSLLSMAVLTLLVSRKKGKAER